MSRKLFFFNPLSAALVVGLTFCSGAQAQLVEGEVLIEAGSDWDYLLYAPDEGGGVFTPLDPATADVDFHTTWQVATGYDGPPFLSGAAPLGYGDIAGDPIATNIWGARDGSDEPPSGSRYTAYFRKTFTPTENVENVRLSSIVDDGVIIYIDGVEFTRTTNFDPPDAADAWDLLTQTADGEGNGDENNPVTGDLPLSLTAGVEVTIAVSLHQTATDSSDLGMNFRLVALDVPPASAPDNDDFAAAEVIDSSSLPVTVTGRTHDASAPQGLGATLEGGEPDHAGVTNIGSVWYTFQPASDGTFRINAAGSNYDAIVAVYTGNSLGGLTEVGSSTEADPFYNGANVIFDGSSATIYRIAVSGDATGGAVLGESFGDVSINISEVDGPIFTEIATLLPAGSNWAYLLYAEDDPVDLTLTNQPVDPASADADFHTTWHTAAAYDGPTFDGPAPALLGYGTINANEITTDIWGARDTDGDPETENPAPPSGLRYAAYFRTTFTPASAVQHLGFRGLVDDGAIIFINGVQVANMNFVGDPSDWQAFAIDTIVTEEEPQEAVAANVNLPANVPVEIAVSLRNPNATSSDMGFDLAVYSIQEPVLDLGKPLSGNDPLLASFDTASDGDMVGLGNGGSLDNLPWSTSSGAAMDESVLPNPPTPAGNALYINSAALNFTSGEIDLTGIDNSQVGVSVDLRTVDTSSGMEAVDNVQAIVQGSLNGSDFSNIGTVVALTGSDTVDPDPLKELELPDGELSTFVLAPGAIAPEIVSIRVVITAVNNSDSEHIYVDNVTVGTDLGPPPAFTATITRQPNGQMLIEWNTDGVSAYELEFGDLSTWSTIASGPNLGSFLHTVPAGVTEGFYRVKRFDD